MVGDFNIKKFLTENKVTVASQHLAEFNMPTIYDKDGKEMMPASSGSFGYGSNVNELDVQDTNVTDSVKEFYELQQEMATMKSRLKEMEGRFKEFEGVIKPMLDEMKELGDKLAMCGEYVIKVTKFGGERMDASYKDAFENALSKVNAATKNVLNEALEASKKLTQVKHSISIQPSDSLQEGVMGRLTSAFRGFLSRLDKKVDMAAKAVEDFINVVADVVPGGEDVDDTPNPVLEGDLEESAVYKITFGDGEVTYRHNRVESPEAYERWIMSYDGGDREFTNNWMRRYQDNPGSVQLKRAGLNATVAKTLAAQLNQLRQRRLAGDADNANPVLEAANSYGMPGSSVVKEKKSGSGDSAPKTPKAPKAAGEKKTNPFEKKEEGDSKEGDSDVEEVLECFKDLSKEQQLEVAKQIAKHLKPKEKKEDVKELTNKDLERGEKEVKKLDRSVYGDDEDLDYDFDDEENKDQEKEKVREELKGGQKKLDKDGDGKISKHDFKLMKKK